MARIFTHYFKINPALFSKDEYWTFLSSGKHKKLDVVLSIHLCALHKLIIESKSLKGSSLINDCSSVSLAPPVGAAAVMTLKHRDKTKRRQPADRFNDNCRQTFIDIWSSQSSLNTLPVCLPSLETNTVREN